MSAFAGGFIVVLSVYLAFHVGCGYAHYRHGRAAGLDPHLFWSLGRGPYVSVRAPRDLPAGPPGLT